MPKGISSYNSKHQGPNEGPNKPPADKKVSGNIEQGSDGKPGGQSIKGGGSGTKAHKMMQAEQEKHSTKN